MDGWMGLKAVLRIGYSNQKIYIVHELLGSGPMGQLQGPFQTSALLSQQAQSLLEEARNENRILEDNVSTLKEQVYFFNCLTQSSAVPWCNG